MSNRIAVYFTSFRPGGIERMMLNLSEEFLKSGYEVDIVVNTAEGSLREFVPPYANLIDLNVSRALFAIPALKKYIQASRPDVFLATQTFNNIAAIFAKIRAHSSMALFVSEHTDLNMVTLLPSIKERLRPLLARLLYPMAAGIIAISEGVAESLAETSRIPAQKISIIYNPVVTANLIEKSQEELRHPWFDSKIPVILSAGRLVPEKDFETLLRAFAQMRARVEARLIILGEGPERDNLERMIWEFGISDDVQLPGYQSNPYAYMSKSALFVLSSTREGLPTVLIEAMACGTPVVSTSCPSGPREILDNGRFGLLTPVGDPKALAEAMEKTLLDPPPHNQFVSRAMDFSAERKAKDYLDLFFGHHQ